MNLVDGAVGGLFSGFALEAVRAWVRLATALDEVGPAPCEADPEAWWVSSGSGRVEDAVYGCSRCPVEELCRAYALAADERAGIWGGVDMAARPRPSRRAA